MSEKKKKLSWIWWVIFPPYAFYLLIRSSLKWYIKVPIVLISILTIVLAIDMTLHPHRVEESKAEQKAITYLLKEEKETVRNMERLGEGVIVGKTEKQPVVYYRFVTDNKLYHIGFVSKNGDDLEIFQVEERYPNVTLIKGDADTTDSVSSLYIAKEGERLGTPESLVEKETDGTTIVKTSKGTYTLKSGMNQLFMLKKGTETILQKEVDEPLETKDVHKFLKEREEKIGRLKQFDKYEVSPGRESYFFTTSKGEYLLELNDDGSKKLKQKN